MWDCVIFVYFLVYLMFGIHDLVLFVLSGLVLNLTPGPDSILIMSHSVSNGWRAGCMAAWGVCAGCYVHVFAAALGLSAILASSVAAFTVVKLLGGAYLIYLGVMALLTRSKKSSLPQASAPAGSPRPAQVFLQGFLSNVLNPKVVLFFLAFAPQFIEHDAPHKPLAFLVLGSIFDFNSIIYCTLFALITAYSGKRLLEHRSVTNIFRKTVGTLFIFFGLKIALGGRNW